MEEYWSFGLCERQGEGDIRGGFYPSTFKPHHAVTHLLLVLWLSLSKIYGFQIVHELES